METTLSLLLMVLLSFALLFHLGTSLNYLRNRKHISCIPQLENEDTNNPVNNYDADLSVCIPCRNEEHNLRNTLDSLVAQTKKNISILILNDQSTDGTQPILDEYSLKYSHIKVIQGKDKPEGWLGKNWACHQLSEKVSTKLIVFQDADVWLSHNALERITQLLHTYDALTVWPHQKVLSFFERLIVPSVYYSLFTLFPAAYLHRKPRWLPAFLYPRVKVLFTAANGQFMAFNKATYSYVGGHYAVRNDVVEDMALARLVKKSNHSMGMFHGKNTIFCRMYQSAKEVWDGFGKNFLQGFPNMFTFIFMGLLHLFVFILPVAIMIISLWAERYTFFEHMPIFVLASLSVFLFTLQRLSLDRLFSWRPLFSFLHIFSVIWFQVLAIRLIWNKLSGRKVKWKGRPI
jgi:chlorobactene glucosyltransferase